MQNSAQPLPDFASTDILARFPNFKIAGEAQRLSGGFLNYVWRVNGSGNASPKSLILKWSPPYVASSPEIALDPERICIEAKILSAFGEGGDLVAALPENLRLPQLYALFAEHHLAIIEDLGEIPNLSAWLSQPRPLTDAENFGRRIGSFIGNLHRSSAKRPDLAQTFSNPKIQKTRLALQYGNIQKYAEHANLADSARLGEIALKFGKKLQNPGIALIMGDLWLASILVAPRGLHLIDWELAHYGRPAQDVGHFVAHLWMQAHCAPDPKLASVVDALARSFLDSYRHALDDDFERIFGTEGVRESAIHFGSEILTRTVGAFADSYLYAGLPPEDSHLREAIEVAGEHIRAPLEARSFDALGWR